MKWLLTALCTMLTVPAYAAPTFDVSPCACALQGIDFTGANWRVESLSNGLDDYMVDLVINGQLDGFADIEFLVPQGSENRVPLFYWVNAENGEPLYTLKDGARDGSCSKMEVVWDKFMPKNPDWKGGA